MQITCPVCAARYDIEAALNDQEARRALGACAAFDTRLATLLRYIGLFRPHGHALAWARVGRLVDELTALCNEPTIRHGHGATRPATPAIWLAAMAQMVAQRERLKLPLNSHGYLRAVTYAIAERAAAAAETTGEQTRAERADATPRPVSAACAARSNPLYREVLRRAGQWPEDHDEPIA